MRKCALFFFSALLTACVLGVAVSVSSADNPPSGTLSEYVLTDTMEVNRNEYPDSEGNGGYILPEQSSLDSTQVADDNGYWFRFFDGAHYGVYRFALNRAAVKTELQFAVHNQYEISLSTDLNGEWTVIASTTEQVPIQREGYRVTYDATEFLAAQGGDTLYVRIADAKKDDGWGGAIHRIVVNYHIPAMLVTDAMVVDYNEYPDSEGNGGYIVKELTYDTDNAMQNDGYWYRFFDADRSGVYRFTLRRDAERTILGFAVHNQYEISLSTDLNGEWTVIASTTEQVPIQRDGYRVTYDATEFLAAQGGDTLYVRIADAKKDDGWGGAIHSIAVNYYYPAEPQPSESPQVSPSGTPTPPPPPEGKTLEFGNSMVLRPDIADAGQFYGINKTTHTTEGGSRRFCDADAYFIYRVRYPANTTDAYFFAMMDGRDYYVRISTDGETWRDLSYDGYRNEENKNGYNNADFRPDVRDYYFSLTPYLNDGGDTDVYVWFGDRKPDDGYGSNVFQVQFFRNQSFAPTPDPAGTESRMQRFQALDMSRLRREDSRLPDNFLDGNQCAFFDADYYGIYAFDLSAKDAVKLELTIDLRAGYRLSASADKENWVDFGIAGLMYARSVSNASDDHDKSFDLSFLLDSRPETVYIKVGDATNVGGWGGAFRSMALREVVPYTGPASGRNVLEDGKLATEIKLFEDSYLFENRGSARTAVFRSVNGPDAYFVYKLELPEDADSLTLAMTVTNNLKLEISHDGVGFTRVEGADFVPGSEYLEGSGYTCNLTPHLAAGRTIYLRFSDGNLDDPAPTVVKRLFVLYNSPSVARQDTNRYENETIQIFIGGDENDEAAYWLNKGNSGVGTGKDINSRFFDGAAYGLYRFVFAEGAEGVKVIGTVSGTYRVQVSKDGVTWQDRLVAPVQAVPNNGINTVTYLNLDVTDLMADNPERTIYVRISDVTDDNGWGGCVTGLGILSHSGKILPPPVIEGQQPTRKLGPGAIAGICAGGAAAVLLAGAAVLLVKKSRRKKAE